MTDLLQFTINVLISQNKPQCTSQLEFEDRVLFVRIDLHFSLWGAAASIMREIYCFRVSTFPSVNFALNLLRPTGYVMHQQFKLLKPTGHVMRQQLNLLKRTGYLMHQQFNIQQLYVPPTLYLCVLYLSENKQRLVPLTA